MQHEIVSRDEWLERRKKLLGEEKTLTRQRDLVAAARARLPWVKIEQDYVFDGPKGRISISDLFGVCSQLYIKHFMMRPGATDQCVGCSLEVDHMTDLLPHLENHDISYAVVARAPIDEIEVVRKRMGWTIPWVSSYRNDFNYDFDVTFRAEDIAAGCAEYNFAPLSPDMAGIQDLSGGSVFYKDERGEIFHTYSRYGRGGEDMLGIYGLLDAMPKGRNEKGPFRSLADWARPRDMYGKDGTVEGNGRYHAAACCHAVHDV